MHEVLLERDDVLGAAEQALGTAALGRGRVLAVRGDAGAGKTSVLAAVEARADGFTVVRARGEEMETGLSFAVLERLLEALDPGGPAGPAEVQGPVLERSVPHVRALERLRRRATAPLLVVLDDLHWADADSLTAIAFLARRLTELPVLLLVGVRPWPGAAGGAVEALAASGYATVHDLGPLSPAAGHALLRAGAGGAEVSEQLARRVHEHCGGNPLLLSHVAAALGRGEDLLDATPGPPDRRRLLLRRFADLDADALALVRAAALLGVSFQPGVAVGLAGLADERAVGALDDLSRSGAIEADGPGQLRFAHPLLRQALYDDLAPGVRQRWHAAAFTELLRRGRSAEAAEHAVRADLAGDARAADVLERVGRAALSAGGLEVAVEHLEAAVRFLGDRAGVPLLLTLAEALCALGRVDEAARRCQDVLELPDVEWRSRVEALMLRGRCAYLTGEPDRGTSELHHAVELAAMHDEVAAIRPLLEQIVSTWMASGPGWALPLAVRAREIAIRSGDPALREAADIAWGDLAAETGDPEGRAATLSVARWLESPARGATLPIADLVSPLSPIYPFAHCALYVERFDEAAAAFDLAATRLAGAGAADASAVVEVFRSNLLLRRGRLQQALDAIDRAGRYGEFTAMTVPVIAAQRSLILTWMGRDGEALAAREAALHGGTPAWPIRNWIAWGDGLRALWAGDPAASVAFLEVERILAAAGVRELNHTPYAAHAVAAHLLAGRDDEARRIVGELELVAPRHPGRWPRHAAVLSRARIDERAGRTAEAQRGFDEAAALLTDVDLPLSRVEALLAAGALRRRDGRPSEARTSLAEARRLAEHHGARPLARLAADELRLAGGRRRRGNGDRDRLTPAELRVARAAAAGRTNAEIAASLHLSTNTVASHLKRVYLKLGIDGRRRLASVELPDDVAEAPPAGDVAPRGGASHSAV